MIKKKNKLKPDQFLQRVFNRRREMQGAQVAINTLEKQWIQENCPNKVGDTVVINKTADGHTSFLISKIHVDIDQIEDKDKKAQFSIQFSFSGLFRGEGVEDKPGRTRFNVVKAEDNGQTTL